MNEYEIKKLDCSKTVSLTLGDNVIASSYGRWNNIFLVGIVEGSNTSAILMFDENG